MIADMRGETPGSSIEEVQLIMEQNSIFVTAIPYKPEILAFVMTDKAADRDVVWQGLRASLNIITEASP